MRLVDLQLIARHPKVFVGLSDTTVSHLMFQRAGVRSFYGPSVMYGFAEYGGLSPYTSESFKRTVMSSEPIGLLRPHTGESVAGFNAWSRPETCSVVGATAANPPWLWLGGEERRIGRLYGGCVELLGTMINGTSLWPSASDFWDDKILFLDYSRELALDFYATWFFRNLAAQGILARLQGILIGRQHFTVTPEANAALLAAVRQVVHAEERLHHLPIVMDMDFGHVVPMLTLPYGVLAEIDGTTRQITILEAGVRD